MKRGPKWQCSPGIARGPICAPAELSAPATVQTPPHVGLGAPGSSLAGRGVGAWHGSWAALAAAHSTQRTPAAGDGAATRPLSCTVHAASPRFPRYAECFRDPIRLTALMVSHRGHPHRHTPPCPDAVVYRYISRVCDMSTRQTAPREDYILFCGSLEYMTRKHEMCARAMQ